MSTHTLKPDPQHTLIDVITTEHPSFICIRMFMNVYTYARRHTFSNLLVSPSAYRERSLQLYWELTQRRHQRQDARRKSKRIDKKIGDKSWHTRLTRKKKIKKRNSERKIVKSFCMNIRLQRCTDVFISLCVTAYAHLWVVLKDRDRHLHLKLSRDLNSYLKSWKRNQIMNGQFSGRLFCHCHFKELLSVSRQCCLFLDIRRTLLSDGYVSNCIPDDDLQEIIFTQTLSLEIYQNVEPYVNQKVITSITDKLSQSRIHLILLLLSMLSRLSSI